MFDTDETWLHKAHLFNYLGIGSVDGTAFLKRAQAQVDNFGVDRHERAVTDVEATDDGFLVTTDEDEYEGPSLVLATDADRSLAESLGCAFDGDLVEVDLSVQTSVDDAYATGAMVRAEEQAIMFDG